MAKLAPDKATRDANLDALKSAVKTWSKKEQDRLENETKFMRAVLQGRTGSTEAGTSNLAVLQDILKKEIQEFLEFGATT
jgi:molybdenum cofactor biosynthesis enzyme MoaA